MGYLPCTVVSTVDSLSLKSTTPPHDNTHSLKHFSYTDLESATSGFSPSHLLGRGSHASVYKALLPSGRLVAVKKPTRAAADSETENEIHILSQFRTSGFVNLLGFTEEDDLNRRRLLVVEFMPNGTLFDSLHSSPRPPRWRRRIRIALQTAKAIETLHSSSPPVIHRDIKSTNVLIDGNFNARLGDFGLALRFQSNGGGGVRPAGTIGYIDPCYVKADQVSTKSDVFSFGILLLEIISGRKAMDVGRSPPCVVDWAVPLIKKGKLSMVFDQRVMGLEDGVVRRELAGICLKCVRISGERRPSMVEVVRRLSFVNKIVSQWNGLSGIRCRPLNYAEPCAKSAMDVVDGRLKTTDY